MTTDADLKVAAMRACGRREFLRGGAGLLGGLLLGGRPLNAAFAAELANPYLLDFTRDPGSPLSPLPPEFTPRARRVIYMHMDGGPSHLELFDYKPELRKHDGKDCPAAFLEGKRFAFLRGVPKLLGPVYPFKQHGESGAWVSDRLPHLANRVDDICFIKSMRTDQFNHAPAQILLQTGESRAGFPSLGSWVTYALGTENQNLPGFVVMLSGRTPPSGGSQLWGNGFLPGVYQGVSIRSEGAPILYLDNPDGIGRAARRRMLDSLQRVNGERHERFGSPETVVRSAQYEMAYRMQTAATEVLDIARESRSTLAAYGAEPGVPSFATNCLRARRLIEKGVRFVQLHDWGWDDHGTHRGDSLDGGFIDGCREIDQPIAALLGDLKQRGLLEETLVVWTGEFGRTPMQENRGGLKPLFLGRDHNPFAFTAWMAGGGARGGFSYGSTDELGYEVAEDAVEIRDLHATILYLLGFNHHNVTFRFEGLDNKLTRVHPARVVGELIA